MVADTSPSSALPEPGPPNPYSCLHCRARKRKCDRIDPCTNCRKGGVECRFVPRRPSTRQPSSMVVLERLNYLEGLVSRMQQQLGPEDFQDFAFDRAIPEQPHAEALTATPDTTTSKGEITHLSSDFGRLAMDDGRSRYMIRNCWASLDDEVEDLKSLLQRRTDEEWNFGAASGIGISGHASILGFGSTYQSLSRLHPQPKQISVYWRLFKENCDVLIKVLHVPTLEAPVLQAMQRVDCIPRGLEALLMTIYFTVVVSLSPEECLLKLGDDKASLLSTFKWATEQALSQAGLLETDEMVVLQAFTIYMTGLRIHNSLRVMSSLTALLVRLAQHAGIHRDGTHFNLPPFVTEMRRRLWWSICVLDSRASEDTGYDTTISHANADTQLPLNVNDSDLFPDMTQLPQPRIGLTEMTFSVVRFESTKVFQQLQDMSQSPVGSDKAIAQQCLEEKKKTIGAIQKRLHELYLKHLDVSNPLSWYTSTISQIVFTKMSLVTYHPCLRKDSALQLSQDVRHWLFKESIAVIEYWLRLNNDIAVRQWRWLCETYFQWYALTFLLSELCVRTDGEEVARAWSAVDGALQLGVRIHTSSCQITSTAFRQQRDPDEPDCELFKPLTKLLQRARRARSSALASTAVDGKVIEAYRMQQHAVGEGLSLPSNSSLPGPGDLTSVGNQFMPHTSRQPAVAAENEMLFGDTLDALIDTQFGGLEGLWGDWLMHPWSDVQ